MNRRALLLFGPALLLPACKETKKGIIVDGDDRGERKGDGSDASSRSMSDRSQELELAYALEVESGGGAKTVADTYEFRSKDRFRVLVRPQFDAHVYLWARGPGQDKYKLLFPEFNEETANPLKAKSRLALPGRDAWLKMDSKKGLEAVVLIAADRAIPEFNTTEKAIGRDEFEERLAQVERIYRARSSRRFVKDEWVTLYAARGGKGTAWIERLPLLHD